MSSFLTRAMRPSSLRSVCAMTRVRFMHSTAVMRQEVKSDSQVDLGGYNAAGVHQQAEKAYLQYDDMQERRNIEDPVPEMEEEYSIFFVDYLEEHANPYEALKWLGYGFGFLFVTYQVMGFTNPAWRNPAAKREVADPRPEPQVKLGHY
eukprot:Clim_evm244s157 gene=Clim_evmTU244s157